MLWTVICEIRNYVIQLEKNARDTKWKTCILESNLKFAILHEYVKKYVSDESIQDVRFMQLNKMYIEDKLHLHIY